jgi:DNA modification methylase
VVAELQLQPLSQRDLLLSEFADKLKINHSLDRKLVSYQNDKVTPFYRWFKYREGFTAQLVEYLLAQTGSKSGTLLDPFAGSGAALFSAANCGWQTCGIEVLPVGVYIIEARNAANLVNREAFADFVEEVKKINFADFYNEKYALKHIAITRDAFPADTEKELAGYINYCTNSIKEANVQKLALFAGFCILESISYTRKDGQFLRWDKRSGRALGKTALEKNDILGFREALFLKLSEMVQDLYFGVLFQRSQPENIKQPEIMQGSSLGLLPNLESNSIDVILTSPPYCNRYDYTRTYALELVYLGATHADVTRLRQNMLSCTVENKTKEKELEQLYRQMGQIGIFEEVREVFSSLHALQEVLDILANFAATKELNNVHVARMVRNYFFEMCFVIYEMARIVKPGGKVIMVNDNVRYAGEEIPVDLILSMMARAFGLTTDVIWTLPKGKGNSSQQMGIHGRSELRKCVYVWHKS